MDLRMKTALKTVAVVGCVAALVAWAFWGARTSLSVALGATIALTNLYFLARIVVAMLRVPEEGEESSTLGAGGWGLLALVKITVLLAAMWFLVSKGHVLAMGLLAGYGSLPIGIVIGSIVSDKTAGDLS